MVESYEEDICESIPYRPSKTTANFDDCRADEYILDETALNVRTRDDPNLFSDIWNIEPCDKSYHAFNSEKLSHFMSRPHSHQSDSLQPEKSKRHGFLLYVEPESGNVLGKIKIS